MMDEKSLDMLHQEELEEALDMLNRTFEELKVIRNELAHDEMGRVYTHVAKDMVQNLIWRVGHYIGEF